MVDVLAIIQCRLSSTRLPAKALLNLAGKTLLARVVESIKASTAIDQLIIATSDQAEDDLIAVESERLGEQCYRGDLNHVLGRFYEAAKYCGANNIVRITADNPLTSASLIDELVRQYKESGCDYVRYADIPYGSGVEVFKFSALEQAYHNASLADDLEHVTPYIIRERSAKILSAPTNYQFPKLRVTVDNINDYVKIASFYNYCNEYDLSPCLEEFINYVRNYGHGDQ